MTKPEPMTEERLQGIKRRIAEAMNGPWRFVADQYNGPQGGDDKAGSIVADDSEADPWYLAEVCGDVPGWEANAALIAACRQDLPDLVSEVERQGERIEELERALWEAQKELVRMDKAYWGATDEFAGKDIFGGSKPVKR